MINCYLFCPQIVSVWKSMWEPEPFITLLKVVGAPTGTWQGLVAEQRRERARRAAE